nr:immunoglobulin light chain junction region [Mus musculus]NSL99547.1 immunoglobulin light chain junction region [Mus musculus]NSM01082.1 immunoglobulin light chain junction region [Mus musculus]NSM01721.1 immunoglobulin light chain junction region [Mus musculus]NSM01878.1 immunoglobulin light chain junction region [Mus musculus]
CQQGNTLPLTF